MGPVAEMVLELTIQILKNAILLLRATGIRKGHNFAHFQIFSSATETCTSLLSRVGVTKPISSVPLFSQIFSLSKHTLTVEYCVYIWQVSPQLSCGDTCQIWMSFEESNMYFCEIENFAYGEINERSFINNPHPLWPHKPFVNSDPGCTISVWWCSLF